MTTGPTGHLCTLLRRGKRDGPPIVPGRIGSGWAMAHPGGVAERADSVDEPTRWIVPWTPARTALRFGACAGTLAVKRAASRGRARPIADRACRWP